MTRFQTLAARAGEVAFRGDHATYMERLLPFLERTLVFREERLFHRVFDGLLRGPVLEIGAELCLNGMILESRLGVPTVAADLSRDALRQAATYGERLGLSRLPFRICCDAYRLPFRNRAFAGVLAWGVLHHFPDAAPVLREAARVLHPDGALVFEEEPIRRRLSLALWRTGTPPELTRFEAALLRIGLLPYLATIGGRLEEERGVLERAFRVEDLEREMGAFHEVSMHLHPQLTGGIASAGPLLRRALRKMLGRERADRAATRWFGGEASGVARKHERGLLPGPGVSVADNGTWTLGERAHVLVKRAAVHDRLGIVVEGEGAAELRVLIHGTPPRVVDAGPTGERYAVVTEIPTEVRALDIVPLEIHLPRASACWLDKVFLDSTRATETYFEHRPLAPPPRVFDPARALGCPDCLVVSERCRIDDFNRPALARAWGDAVTIAGTPEVRPGAPPELICTAPFGYIDRAPLVSEDAGWRCVRCGRRFSWGEGVLTLLPRGTEEELYGTGAPETR